MKKRIVSFICAVSVIAAMLCVGAIGTFADGVTVANGKVIEIADSFTPTDWTSSSGSSWTWDGGAGTLTAPALNNSAVEELTYNTAYDFSSGFEIAYSSKGNKSKDNYYLNNLYETVKLGNVQVGLTPISETEPKNLLTADMTADDGVALFIKVGDNIVANDFIITKDKNYHSNANMLSHAWKLYYYYTYTDIDKFACTVKYDAVAKTVTATLKYDNTPIATATYTDTASAINVSDAKFSLASANAYKQNATYANVTVKGGASEISSSTPESSTPVSSAPVSSTPVSSAPVSSAPVSSAPVSSAPVSSTPVSSAPVSSTPESIPSAAAPVANGIVIEIADSFNSSDWTSSGDSSWTWNSGAGTLTAPELNNKSDENLIYNTAYDFSGGFDITYSAMSNKTKNNYIPDTFYNSVKLGNVQVGLVGRTAQDNLKAATTDVLTDDDAVELVIQIGDNAVAKAAVINKNLNYHENSTNLAHAWKLFYYYTYKDIDKITYNIAYNATTKTITATLSYDGTLVASAAYVDESDAINVSNAQFAFDCNNSYKQNESFANVTVKGGASEGSSSTPSSSTPSSSTPSSSAVSSSIPSSGTTESSQQNASGTISSNTESDALTSSAAAPIASGKVIEISDSFTADDWTVGNNASNWTFNESDGTITAPKANNKKDDTLTFNTAYDYSNGFNVTFSAMPNKGADNYYANCLYTGVALGNVKVGLMLATDTDPKSITSDNITDDDSVKLVVMVDDEVVASDFVISKDKNYRDGSAHLARAWKYFYYYTYTDINKLVYNVNYDATANTVTATLSYDSTLLASATYADTANTIDVSNAKFALVSNDSYNMVATYANVTVGDKDGDDGDSSGSSDSSESDTPDNIQKGEAIAAVIETEFTASDWDGNVECIQSDGTFFIKSKAAKLITSKTKYDFSNGFELKSTLVMKNGYTNYYGEWCSVYLGDTATGLELRIKNIEGQGLYTAHLLYEGKELATYDLANMPNGEYAVKYVNGKVTVTLDGVAIGWKLADGSTSTSVSVNLDKLVNDSVSFKIEGNYHSTDRYWKGFRLAPVGKDTTGTNGTTGDARNLVIPMMALVASACAVVFVAKRRRIEG